MKSKELLRTATATTLIGLLLSANIFAQTTTGAPDALRESPPDNYGPYPAVPVTRPPNGSQVGSPPAPVVDSESSDYSWLLNQVRLKRQQATANLRAQQQATANQGKISGDEHRKIHELRRNYEDHDTQLQDREERVNRQLDRLERLLKEHEVLNQNAPTTIAQDEDQPPQQPSPRDAEATAQETNPQPSGMITKPIASNSAEANTTPPEADSDDIVSPEATAPSFSSAQVDAIALTNQTVDSLALANNLYGTGEYSLALKIYSKVDQSEMVPDDKIWIRFQVANCQRQLGRLNEAHRGYRIVTSAAGESRVGQTARWWLDATDRAARLNDRIKSLQASYGQLRKEVNEPANP